MNLIGNAPKRLEVGSPAKLGSNGRPAKKGSTDHQIVGELRTALALVADCGRMTGKPEVIPGQKSLSGKPDSGNRWDPPERRSIRNLLRARSWLGGKCGAA